MTDRSALLAAGAELAGQGWDVPTERLVEFCTHYFRYVDDEDLLALSPEEIAMVVGRHAAVARVRKPGETKVELMHPVKPGFSSLLFIVTDDRSFVVDTASMAVTDQNWAIRQLFHPQYQVIRNEAGEITDVVHRVDRNPAARGESWVCIAVYPPFGQSSQDRGVELVERVQAGLDEGAAAVADFRRMLGRVSEAQVLLRSVDEDSDDIAGPFGLLSWLTDNNFTFLGYAEYQASGDEFVPVKGSGLGIYRGERGLASEPVPPPVPFVLTKDPEKSRVHRPSYLDKIVVRRIEDGVVLGEKRFVGLFTSTAWNEPIDDIPFLAGKASQILARTGYATDAHGAKAIVSTLATYPREELLQASVDELYDVVVPVSRLNERRVVRTFIRKSPDGRFVNALVFFPRDRYNTQVREAMQDVLKDAFGATSLEYQARLGESSVARLYFVLGVPPEAVDKEVSLPEVRKAVEAATRSWEDDFMRLADEGLAAEERGIEFSDAYMEAFTPTDGLDDLRRINSMLADGRTIDFSVVPDGARMWLRVYLLKGTLTLSDVLPQLATLGVEVHDEWPYEFTVRNNPVTIYEFSLHPVGFTTDEVDHHRFVDAFAAAQRGQVEADTFSGLVTKAGLTWTDAAILRVIARYLRQTGAPYSQTYLARALLNNPGIARDLASLFHARFDPASSDEALADAVHDRLVVALDAITSLDIDKILRGYLAVIDATVRTNAFAPDGPFAWGSSAALALKLHPRELDFAPDPKPLIEVYVYSPRVEGVHLRFAKVARGGLRWSDRAEDYRTEVLGLVKAQMVKNTVIVPSGAKGGFYARKLPDPALGIAPWKAEGVAAYQDFITALLSITDNIVDGEVVHPDGVLSTDGDDPYLVVAADKGTATFSDTANAIAVGRGFWLGDAFASGGSQGYDHKAMGITARGAWESVKRHFFELGIDCQTTDFTVVGIGDMAGDVFGNGMLLSEHIRLVAAFNHRHIVIDPTPDASVSFAERQRLFELPGSAWTDYDPALISAGGGVFDRSSKSVTISPEAATALGIEPGRLTPDEVISAILRAPVDLLWNGGIGTYVKARTETHASVGDRANDALRVNGDEVRARVAGEGGNLGWTQAGRIEYARGGGRINTDFIDNSAGVDTSDHEVNIKILLSGPVADGRLSTDERNDLLQAMTDDVATHVLAHNIDQNMALANARSSAARYVGLHDDWMNTLTAEGYLDRALEGLPTSAELVRRIERGEGLTGPELASLLAWTKIWLNDAVLATDLPDDPFVSGRLVEYFPKALRAPFADDIATHRLRREIVSTVAVNRFVNSQGISAYHRLADATNAGPADVIRAQLATRSLFTAGRFEQAIERAGLDAAAGTQLRIELRALVERGTQWILLHRPRPLDIVATVDELTGPARAILARLREALTPAGRARYDERLVRLGLDQLPAGDELVPVVAGALVADRALSVVDIAAASGADPLAAATASFGLTDHLGLDDLAYTIEGLPQFVRWDTLARSALLADLGGLRDELLRRYLAAGASDPVEWLEAHQRCAETKAIVEQVADVEPDLAKASVALRAIRGMIT